MDDALDDAQIENGEMVVSDWRMERVKFGHMFVYLCLLKFSAVCLCLSHSLFSISLLFVYSSSVCFVLNLSPISTSYFTGLALSLFV